MPSLKEYRDRIVSVKSTRKITSAMKMVAASKLKRAQEQAEASQPYASAMANMMARVASGVVISPSSPKLLIGTGSDQRHLLLVITSDRGLAGGFNANILRRARQDIRRLQNEGKDVSLVCVGRKAHDLLRREFGALIVKSFSGLGGKSVVTFAEVDQIAQLVLERFDADLFDVCTILYNEFKSVLVQRPVSQQLIPFTVPETNANDNADAAKDAAIIPYSFEPAEDEILQALLPRNIGVQLFRALLDSAAGEQAARMTAMDNATRNAGELINRVTLQYNRARQAHITKELIEIISGAEAV